MPQCPICNESLSHKNNSFVCSNSHNYDISKEGYINLLMANKKAYKLIGDTKEMVTSRNNFLNKGFYDQIPKSIISEIKEQIQNKKITLLDVGCGEGYYTNKITCDLVNNNYDLTTYGFDLSKDAVKSASKKYKTICFFVANTYKKIPFQNNSIDLIINIFAPRNKEEFSRILKANGEVIIIIPTSEHLKELLYILEFENITDKKDEDIINHWGDSFELISNKSLIETKLLEVEDIKKLIQMTPLIYQMNDYLWQKINSLEKILITFSFQMLCLKRR